MAELEESKEFVKNLLTTGIRGTVWPNKAYLVAVIKDRSGKVIWKNKYQTLPNANHTERQLLCDQEFIDAVEKENFDEIILTSNYSPCKDCAEDLIKFYEESRTLKLTVRFSHPYENRYKNHLEGLKDLDRAGITLEAMTEKSWLDVLEFLFDLDPGAVMTRDVVTREKLEDLLRSFH